MSILKKQLIVSAIIFSGCGKTIENQSGLMGDQPESKKITIVNLEKIVCSGVTGVDTSVRYIFHSDAPPRNYERKINLDVTTLVNGRVTSVAKSIPVNLQRMKERDRFSLTGPKIEGLFFDKKLRVDSLDEKIPSSQDKRPFICDGNILDFSAEVNTDFEVRGHTALKLFDALAFAGAKHVKSDGKLAKQQEIEVAKLGCRKTLHGAWMDFNTCGFTDMNSKDNLLQVDSQKAETMISILEYSGVRLVISPATRQIGSLGVKHVRCEKLLRLTQDTRCTLSVF